jgi:4-amino-4-deoxy-L-arabinose transferase-like glycosyltransferase
VLCKGPQHVALVAVIICFYLFLVAAKTGKHWYKAAWQYALQLHPIAGIVLIAVLSLPIYIASNTATGGEFFQEFFVRQMLGRATGTANHQNPWHYYVPFFAGGFFPWWLLPLFAFRLIQRLFVQRRRNATRAQLPLFCVCWIVTTLFVFQLLITKLGTYILPAAPPLAILCGWTADRLLRLKNFRPLIALALTAAVPAIVALFLPHTGRFLDTGSAEFKVLALGGVTALAVGWSTCLALIAAKRANLALLLAQLCTVCGVAAGTLAATCIYDTIEDKPSREVYQYCARQPNANIALFMRSSPAAYFYLRRRMPVLNFATELESFVRTTPGPHLLIVTDDVLWIATQRAAHLKELNRHGKCTVFCLDP